MQNYQFPIRNNTEYFIPNNILHPISMMYDSILCDNIYMNDICNLTSIFSLNNLLNNFDILNFLIENEKESTEIINQNFNNSDVVSNTIKRDSVQNLNKLNKFINDWTIVDDYDSLDTKNN